MAELKEETVTPEALGFAAANILAAVVDVKAFVTLVASVSLKLRISIVTARSPAVLFEV